MTINYSSDNDIIIPTQHNTTYRGLGGDDIYIITRAISDGAKINIVDTEGTNIIQLTEGLSISSSKFASTAFQITLSNNAEITISSSHKNLYEIGGNATTGLIVDQNSYEDFITFFGINSLPSLKSIKGLTNLIIEGEKLVTNNKIFSWEIKNPESVGIDTSEVSDLMDFVKSEGSNTQAAILIRGSSIIAEYYADNFDKDSVVTSWSVAKSFTSTLIGIAIDEGYISSINDPITDYLPEWKGKDQDNILLKHLLAMQSGMDDHPLAGVVFSTNMVKYSLDRDVLRPPETAFSYSNEDSMLLGEILENATGFSVQDYADKKLFNILEIEDKWWTDQAGNTVTYAGLDMNPRDFAKFGLMVAQDGKWENKEVVSSEWLETATNNYNDLAPYGFQWWTSNSPDEKDYNFFSAKGLDGQLIYVWPEIDLVFVRFTKYQHVGDKESSVVNFPTSYQNTESGNLPTVKLEELLYDIGDNLILNSDIIVTNDFG